MTFLFEYKVLDDDVPVIEHYTDIKRCEYYFAHGRPYLRLYKNNSDFRYDFCIDLLTVKTFKIEN